MKLSRGFTLIESIISIVVLAIAMVTITTMLMPAVQRSAEPQYQVRAAALAETIFSQILSRSFDHNSDHEGGFYRCGESDYLDEQGLIIGCTSEDSFGPEQGEEPSNYNDVDDYGAPNGTSVSYTLDGAGDRSLSELVTNTDDYHNFRVDITVVYAENQVDVLKKITLDIKASPNGPSYSFTAYKGNY
ncbi:type IV pilus modification PilV family protein [Vibrio astriarenae]|uniref:type IV pilus modification PilV family protein n=1 Tax=Vibrio astriarenae TaxID=1481923 RepID=UPI003734E261